MGSGQSLLLHFLKLSLLLHPQRFLLFLCALLALAIGMLGVGCAAVAAAILVYLWYIQMARREFGGLTGDLAGWFLQVCELGCLAAMVLAREIAEVLI